MNWMALVLMLVTSPALADIGEDASLKTQTFALGPLHVDKVYPSMTGPLKEETTTLGAPSTSPIWLKSFRVDVEDERGRPERLEYLCHSWLMLTEMGPKDQALLTVSQGLAEMKFPEGFAIRTPQKKENIRLLAQALNNNEKIDKKLTYKLTVSYLDDDVARRLKIRPLRTSTVAVLSKQGLAATAHDRHAMMGGTGSDDKECPDAHSKDPVHFEVPPGRHEYKTPIDPESLFVGKELIVHYIKLHLHPYGESITLTDKTTGKILWKGKAKNATDRAALVSTDEYSSKKGFRMIPTHAYEISSVYDNKSNGPIDAMAVLRLYSEDVN